MTRFWTCQRVSGGVKCGAKSPRVKRNCIACGKPRPKTKQPAHMAALNASYEQFVELNGGEHCAICGRAPSAARRLDRDHDHTGAGRPRGLLCARCNRALPNWCDAAWLRAAAAYLERDVPAPGVRAVTPIVERRAA